MDRQTDRQTDRQNERMRWTNKFFKSHHSLKQKQNKNTPNEANIFPIGRRDQNQKLKIPPIVSNPSHRRHDETEFKNSPQINKAF